MKIGDRVVLKSGGPTMTVAAIQKDDPKLPASIIMGTEVAATKEAERLIGCVWWNTHRFEFMDKAFPCASLLSVEEKPEDGSQAS